MNTPERQDEETLHALAKEWAEQVDPETRRRLQTLRQDALQTGQSRRRVWQQWPVAGWAVAAVLGVAVSLTFWPGKRPGGMDDETLAALAEEAPIWIDPEMLESMDELVLLDAEALLLEMDEAGVGDDAA